MEIANRSIMGGSMRPYGKLNSTAGAPAWDAATTYAEGDIVSYKGNVYQTGASTTGEVPDAGSPWHFTTLSARIADKAPLASPAFTGTPTAPTPTTGDDSTKIATTAFVQGSLRYALGTTQTISTASQDSSSGTTINYGAATLLDRTVNQVAVTAALDELRLTVPSSTAGKARDFSVRLEVGSGSAALSAPTIVVIAPSGETVVCENSTGVWPVAESGTATAKGVTMLYFSEISDGHFLFQGRKMVTVSPN